MSETALPIRATAFAARAHAGPRRGDGRLSHVDRVIEAARLAAEDGRAAIWAAAPAGRRAQLAEAEG